MKTSRLITLALLACASAAPVAASAAVVLGPTYSYTFTATPGNPEYTSAYDGSMISIQNNAVIDWNLIYTTVGADYTPANSAVISNNIVSYSANTWQGSFQIGPAFVASTGFQQTIGSDFFGTGTGTTPDTGSLDYFLSDPPGTWSPANNSVPDSGSTLALLAIGCGALLVASKCVIAARS